MPFFHWLDLQGRIARRRRWQRVDHQVEFFEEALAITPWNTRPRVAIYRKRVYHRSAKNYQLDLFDPNDGYYEYSAVASNLDLTAPRLWWFMCGRGAHEKAIGALKSSLAFASIPTQHYGANSAWQQLVALAHNLLTNFQIEGGAPKRPRGFRATALFVLKSVQTLRFKLFHRAGLLLRPNGCTILRLAANPRSKGRARASPTTCQKRREVFDASRLAGRYQAGWQNVRRWRGTREDRLVQPRRTE